MYNIVSYDRLGCVYIIYIVIDLGDPFPSITNERFRSTCPSWWHPGTITLKIHHLQCYSSGYLLVFLEVKDHQNMATLLGPQD